MKVLIFILLAVLFVLSFLLSYAQFGMEKDITTLESQIENCQSAAPPLRDYKAEIEQRKAKRAIIEDEFMQVHYERKYQSEKAVYDAKMSLAKSIKDKQKALEAYEKIKQEYSPEEIEKSEKELQAQFDKALRDQRLENEKQSPAK